MIHKEELNKIHCGDCNAILQTLPDNSMDLVITSPPYFQQRDYGGGGIGNEKTVEEYVASWNDENYIIPEKYYKKAKKKE